MIITYPHIEKCICIYTLQRSTCTVIRKAVAWQTIMSNAKSSKFCWLLITIIRNCDSFVITILGKQKYC